MTFMAVAIWNNLKVILMNGTCEEVRLRFYGFSFSLDIFPDDCPHVTIQKAGDTKHGQIHFVFLGKEGMMFDSVRLNGKAIP